MLAKTRTRRLEKAFILLETKNKFWNGEKNETMASSFEIFFFPVQTESESKIKLKQLVRAKVCVGTCGDPLLTQIYV